MLSRRSALTTIAGAVSLTVAPTGTLRAQTPATSTLRVALIPIFDVAPMFAAQQQGYLAEEHLSVTVTNIGGGGAAIIPALVGGDFDVGYCNAPSVAQAIQRGIDLRIVLSGMGVTATPPAPVALVKKSGDPISTGKDLEGKALAVNALANVQWMVARAWVKATGGDPDKVNYAEIPIPTMTEAITQGRVACAMLIDPFLTVALEQKDKFALMAWPFNRVYANAPIAFWVVNAPILQTKAPLVQGFVRAYRRGVTWINDNRGKDALIQLLASYTQLQPDLLRKLNFPVVGSNIDTAHFGIMLNMMRDNKLLTSNVDLVAHVYNVS